MPGLAIDKLSSSFWMVFHFILLFCFANVCLEFARLPPAKLARSAQFARHPPSIPRARQPDWRRHFSRLHVVAELHCQSSGDQFSPFGTSNLNYDSIQTPELICISKQHNLTRKPPGLLFVMVQNGDLNSLIDQFDDWFKDLNLEKPIDQCFQMAAPEIDRRLEYGQDAISEQDRKFDELFQTTDEWFKILAEPPITNDNLHTSDNDDSEEIEACARRAEIEEDIKLDTLAKDLDQLLDDDSPDHDTAVKATTNRKKRPRSKRKGPIEKKEDARPAVPEIFYFSIHDTDEHALADPEIGQCYTIETSPGMASSLGQVTVSQSSLRSSYQSSINSRSNGTQSSVADHRCQTPMPADHDYLARPRQKPLNTCNWMHRQNDEPSLYLMASRKDQKLASVLNTVAIRRFARFSDRMRLLSCE